MSFLQRGTYLISFISAFFIVTNLLMKIAGYSDTAWDWELLFLVVDTIALASMFYGVYAERAAFVQPFVVLSVCFCVHLKILNLSVDHDVFSDFIGRFHVLCSVRPEFLFRPRLGARIEQEIV
jgi:hypothetical protein